jgi:hypothetical protein
MQFAAPPPWPFWPITITTAAMATAVYLHRRAVANRRSGAVRVAIVAGVVLLFAAPTGAILLGQESGCSDTGYGATSETNWVALGAMLLVLVGAMWPLGVAAGQPLDRAWRLPAVVAGALVGGYVLEGIMSLMALGQYCESSPGLLYLHATLAVVLPLVGLGIARTWQHE